MGKNDNSKWRNCKYITTVRKDINSNDWFLGSITNEDAREIEISLSFLEPEIQYNATIYKDPKKKTDLQTVL